MTTTDTINDTATINTEAAQDMRRAVSKLLTAPERDARKSIKAIDFNGTWYPFLTAAKASGALPDLKDSDLGAAIMPKIRKVNGKDTVMRGKNGRILTEVAKPVAEACVLMHRAMVYQCLTSPAESFRAANPEVFAAQAAAQERAGKPVLRAAQELVFMSQLEQEAAQ